METTWIILALIAGLLFWIGYGLTTFKNELIQLLNDLATMLGENLENK